MSRELKDAIESLRQRLCNDEPAWRDLCVVMAALTAMIPQAAPEGCPKCGEKDAPLKWDSGKCWTCGYCVDDLASPPTSTIGVQGVEAVLSALKQARDYIAKHADESWAWLDEVIANAATPQRAPGVTGIANYTARFDFARTVLREHGSDGLVSFLNELADAALAAPVSAVGVDGLRELAAKWHRTVATINSKRTLLYADIATRDATQQCAYELETALANVGTTGGPSGVDGITDPGPLLVLPHPLNPPERVEREKDYARGWNDCRKKAGFNEATLRALLAAARRAGDRGEAK